MQNDLVKPKAFERKLGTDLSVSRIEGFTDSETWADGDVVGSSRGKSVKARADLRVADVVEAELRVESRPPPPHHAEVVGWPDSKDAAMNHSQVLAKLSKLRVRPTSGASGPHGPSQP